MLLKGDRFKLTFEMIVTVFGNKNFFLFFLLVISKIYITHFMIDCKIRVIFHLLKFIIS